MHTQQHRRTRIYLTLLVAAGHLSLVILGLADRLTYSVPSRYALLEQTLANPLWVMLHGVCFIWIVIAVIANKGHVHALGAATGVMAAWAFLSLLWGLSATTGPSLAGPILGGGMSTLSYILTAVWASVPKQNEGNV